MSLDANSNTRRFGLLSELRDMNTTFERTQADIEAQVGEADRELASAVQDVNALLKQIHDVGVQIDRGAVGGEGGASLIDEQDAAVGELAKFMDITVQRRESGRLDVFTSDGTLLSGDAYAELSYSPASVSNLETTFDPVQYSMVHPLTGDTIGEPRNFQLHVTDGEIGALIDLRDKILPDQADQLSAVVGGVLDEFNAAHNNSSAVPAPNTLTGRNSGLVGTDNHNFTGVATIAVTDANGALVRQVNLDFGAVGPTMNDVITAANTALAGDATLALNNGVLSLSATNGAHGVSMIQDEANPSDRGGRGFSHFFGLNDLLRSDSTSYMETGLTAADAHGFTAGETIDFVILDGRGDVTETTFAVPAGATMGDLVTALNNPATGLGQYYTFSLSADGDLNATPNNGRTDLRLQVATDNTDRGGTGVTMSEMFGLGVGARTNVAQNISIRSDIEENPDLLAGAQLDLSGTPAPGDTVLSVGDNRGFLQLEASRDQAHVFDAVGAAGATVVTARDYASQTLASFSLDASIAETAATDANALREDLLEQRNSVQGVNLDEELSQLIVYQQAYNAAARLVSTAQELYDALLNAI